MKTFKQYISEMKGDFGANPPKPKAKCYGRTTTYKSTGQKVCAFKSSSSRGGNGD
jgi:hypothetical protein